MTAINTAPLANSIPEVMRRLGIGKTLLYRELKAGRLKAMRIGSRTIILEDDLKAYLASLPSFDAKLAA